MNNLQEIFDNTFQYFHSLYEIVSENINQSLIVSISESISENLNNQSLNKIYIDNSKNSKNNLESTREVEFSIIAKIEGDDL